MKINRIVASSMMALSLLATSALPMATFAEDGQSESPRTNKVVDVACLKTAIDARDASLKSAFSAFSTSINSAYDARNSALKTALDQPAGKTRREALKTARKGFATSVRTAKTTQKTARKDAWSKFKTDAQACGQSNVEELGSTGEDSNV